MAVRSTLAVAVVPGLTLPTPVMVASGCFSRESVTLGEVQRFGGVVTRTITLGQRRGAATPRMAETPSGLLAQTGFQNPGMDAFLAEEMPELARMRIPVLVSVAAGTVEELMRLVTALAQTEGVAGIEVNACFPSRIRGGRAFSATPEGASEAAGAAARLTRLPVFVKLGIECADVAEVAQSCRQAGAAGVTLIHTVHALALDPVTGRPSLGAGTGGLSGPAIRPLALYAVSRVASAVPGFPILAAGGIATPEDAMQFLLAGASAVQVGTAMFVNPLAPVEISQGILRNLRARGLASPAELRSRAAPAAAEAGES